MQIKNTVFQHHTLYGKIGTICARRLKFLHTLLFMSPHKKKAPKEQREMTQSEKPLREQRKVLGAHQRMKWEGRIHDQLIHLK